MLRKRLLITAIFICVAALPLVCHGETLREKLLSHNFNLYSAPSKAGNLVLQDVRGRVFYLDALKNKVVILNFWKIDCPPCTTEKPILNRVYKKYKDRGLEILCVNLFDNHEKFRTYALRSNFVFPLVYDPAKRFSVKRQKLGGGVGTNFIVNDSGQAIYEAPGVPTTYVIDRNGDVIGSSAGLINWEEEPFTEFINSLLGSSHVEQRALTPSFRTAAGQGVADSEQSGRAAHKSAVDDKTDSQGPKARGIHDKSKAPKQTGPVSGTRRRAIKPSVASANAESADKPKTESTERAPIGAGRPPSGPAAGDVSSLLPLPPAVPYQPAGRGPSPTVQSRQLEPDSDGSVMARIPSSKPAPQRLLHPSNEAAIEQKDASRIGFQGFVMGAFKQPTNSSQGSGKAVPHEAAAPAHSVLEQLGRDFRRLGGNIRDGISRITPGGGK